MVEDLRDQIESLSSKLSMAMKKESEAVHVPAAILPPDDNDGDINRKSWNRAIRAAAAEASHPNYDSDGEGINLRIAEAIMELRK